MYPFIEIYIYIYIYIYYNIIYNIYNIALFLRPDTNMWNGADIENQQNKQISKMRYTREIFDLKWNFLPKHF